MKNAPVEKVQSREDSLFRFSKTNPTKKLIEFEFIDPLTTKVIRVFPTKKIAAKKLPIKNISTVNPLAMNFPETKNYNVNFDSSAFYRLVQLLKDLPFSRVHSNCNRAHRHQYHVSDVVSICRTLSRLYLFIYSSQSFIYCLLQ
jgi:hypothetical protein